MPRVKRKGTRLRGRWTDQQLDALLRTGATCRYRRVLLPEMEPNTPEDWERVRAAWEAQRDNVLAMHRRDKPGRRPWAWWRWNASSERDHGLPEVEQLHRMGELEEAEARDHFERNGYGLPDGWRTDYRRAWFWWHQRRDQTPRRWDLAEAFDLFDQRLLTDEERGQLHDLATDRYAGAKICSCIRHLDGYREPPFTAEQLKQMGLHAAAELWTDLLFKEQTQ